MQTTNASKIEVGRRVRYFAGYGGMDGEGLIVAVHGEPNPMPPQSIHNGIGRSIRNNDCTVDVILFDGRALPGLRQCSIDAPGIGVKLLDRVHGPALVAQARHLHADRAAADALAKVTAREKFEATEAAREITDPPVFYWNGIKDAKGEKLQRAWYSPTSSDHYPENSIQVYARDYSRFSAKVRACFAVHNDTDLMTDYFDSDDFCVIPSHPLYPQAKAAMDALAARRDKRAAKRTGGAS